MCTKLTLLSSNDEMHLYITINRKALKGDNNSKSTCYSPKRGRTYLTSTNHFSSPFPSDDLVSFPAAQVEI